MTFEGQSDVSPVQEEKAPVKLEEQVFRDYISDDVSTPEAKAALEAINANPDLLAAFLEIQKAGEADTNGERNSELEKMARKITAAVGYNPMVSGGKFPEEPGSQIPPGERGTVDLTAERLNDLG